MLDLKRIRICSINIEGIEEGMWRYLTEDEVMGLMTSKK